MDLLCPCAKFGLYPTMLICLLVGITPLSYLRTGMLVNRGNNEIEETMINYAVNLIWFTFVNKYSGKE